ncbi:class I SAM-dependent methyltransferase [Methylobacterium trifolii]
MSVTSLDGPAFGTSSASRGRPFAVAAAGPADERSTRAYVAAAIGEMDRQLHGSVSRDALHWNVSGGPRVARLTDAIMAHVARRGLDRVSVLNMSGLNEGKPDPVLYDLLDRRLGPGRLRWQVVDHPLSQTFSDPTIRGWLDARGIEPIGQDFREPDFSVPEAAADVVLCTEILEHLDYTVTMRLLRRCQRALRPGGVLLVTTPNAVYVEHRLRFALGQWDFLHFMDAPEDAERGLLGHVMYYDGRRLGRMLGHLGFDAVRATTFNAGHGPGEYRNPMTRAAAMGLRALSRLFPHSGQVLLVAAEKPA